MLCVNNLLHKMDREALYTRTKIVVTTALLLCSGIVKAQTTNYLTGNKTGNVYQSGSLIGLGVGNAELTSPMLPHQTGLGNTLRFYYGDTILSTSSSTPTTVTASRVLGLGGLLGSGADAYIQFRTSGNSSLSSGTTVYFKIGTPPAITGLSASVGGLLGLSSVYNITGRGYSGAGNYVLGSSYNENAGSAVGTASGTISQMLVDKNGVWYVGVTPDAAYNSVRLNIAFSSSINLLSVSRDMDVTVYSAHYFSTPSSIDCGAPVFTTAGETQGVNLNLGSATSLLALDTAVTNPEYAIDEDTSTYSRITSGAVGIASSISQTIIYNGLGDSADVATIKFSLPASALTATVLSNLTLTAYNNNTQVGSTVAVSSLLSADVLALLGNYDPFFINFQPGIPYDKVKISLNNLATIGSSILGGGVRVYEVKRVENAPSITGQPSADTVCVGETAIFNATATGDALVYQWEYYNGSAWVSAGTTNPLYITGTTIAMDGRKYRVKVTGGACSSSQSSFTSDEAILSVDDLPITPPVSIAP